MKISTENPIAYFCAEYGLTTDLPIYAGGLGILAGDTLKAAADLKLPVAAIGLMYRGEDQIQEIDETGMQHNKTWFFDPLAAGMEHVYLDDMPLFLKIHLTTVDVWVRVWQKKIGETVTLYLLDTETDQNHLNQRNITHALYSGTPEEQLKQQLILGIGGVKLLHRLGIHPAVYHVNEGRPAFLHWQLIRSYMDQHGLSFQEAHQAAKAKTVYTNHTLVSAGNPGLPSSLVETFGAYYASKMKVEVEELLHLGHEGDEHKEFKLTRFALNTSSKASGVSKLHTELSQQTWPEYDWSSITNGVHLPTWQDQRLQGSSVESMSDAELWQIHRENKRQSMQYFADTTGYGYDPDRLVVGWARRIAGYKQIDKVFEEVERLKGIITRSHRPVQLVIAGKAHFGDSAAKQMLQKIIQYMQQELAGYSLFVPNYNMTIAQHLVRGCDVWLNTPVMGREASGTSGMKACSNGVLQCTVADGWAAEVDWTNVGWVLDHQNISDSWLDTLEDKIAPLYYEVDSRGFNPDWINRIRRSISLAKQFSAQRMVEEYRDMLYYPVVS